MLELLRPNRNVRPEPPHGRRDDSSSSSLSLQFVLLQTVEHGHYSVNRTEYDRCADRPPDDESGKDQSVTRCNFELALFAARGGKSSVDAQAPRFE